ncbi:O-antigen ligase [Brevundimonas sp.]|uniref:O-antigen ligase family protein n=1 Tax=Brevundimonas sp. TaxID=1871086 RepID=UPI0025B9A746|nr:O-antigen ligase family protein [Brevundimonas sp.]MCG2665103.1 O-antigen ligase family protein [Brevundimonas sp.]
MLNTPAHLRRESKSVGSDWLDVVALWAILFSLSGIGIWPHATTGALQERLIINTYISYFSTAVGLIYIVRRAIFINLRPAPFSAYLVVFFVAFVGLSSLWSGDPVQSFTRSSRFIVFTIFVIVQFRYNPDFIKHVVIFSGFFAVINIGSLILSHSHATEQGWLSRAGDWRGLLAYRIALGSTSATLMLIVVFDMLQTRVGAKFFAEFITALGLLMLVYGSQARLAWGAALLGLILLSVMMLVLRFPVRQRSLLSVFVVVFGFVISTAGAGLVPTIAEFWGRDLTFSGRTDLWPILIERALLKPIYGYGVGVFFSGRETLEIVWQAARWGGFSTAHNSYIEWLIALGIPGATLFALLMFFYYVRVLFALAAPQGSGSALIVALAPLVTTQTVFMSEGAFPSVAWTIIALTVSSLGVARRVRKPTI